MKIEINKYKAFFFDFDGVIVDSLHIKTEAFGELFKKYGRDIQQKVMDYHRNNGGVSRYEKFKYYYHNLLNKKINKTITSRLDKQYSKLVVDKVVAASYVDGVLPLIKRLNREKKPCFIISGTPQKEIRYILRRKKISFLFKEATGSPKNKTGNLRFLLGKYKINSRDAIFFGDAKSDWEAARKLNVDFVAMINKKSRELLGFSHLCRVSNFTGLCDWKTRRT